MKYYLNHLYPKVIGAKGVISQHVGIVVKTESFTLTIQSCQL